MMELERQLLIKASQGPVCTNSKASIMTLTMLSAMIEMNSVPINETFT